MPESPAASPACHSMKGKGMETEGHGSKSGFVLDEKVCCDLSLSRSREWLETNCISGYASSMIVGLNSRSDHGLSGCCNQPAGRGLGASRQTGWTGLVAKLLRPR